MTRPGARRPPRPLPVVASMWALLILDIMSRPQGLLAKKLKYRGPVTRGMEGGEAAGGQAQALTMRVLEPPYEDLFPAAVAQQYRDYAHRGVKGAHDVDDPCFTLTRLLPQHFLPAPEGRYPDLFMVDTWPFGLCEAARVTEKLKHSRRRIVRKTEEWEHLHANIWCPAMNTILDWVTRTREWEQNGGRNLVMCSRLSDGSLWHPPRLTTQAQLALNSAFVLGPVDRREWIHGLIPRDDGFIPVPYYLPLGRLETALETERSSFLTFIGSTRENSRCSYKLCHTDRNKMEAYNQNSKRAMQLAIQYRYTPPRMPAGDRAFDDYKHDAAFLDALHARYRASTFCLVPPEDTLSSRRLYDIAVNGCIPVMMIPATTLTSTVCGPGPRGKCQQKHKQHVETLPFAPELPCGALPWDDMVVRMPVNSTFPANAQHLQTVLQQIPPARVRHMQQTIYDHMPCVMFPKTIAGSDRGRVGEPKPIQSITAPRRPGMVSIYGGRRFARYSSEASFKPSDALDAPSAVDCVAEAVAERAWKAVTWQRGLMQPPPAPFAPPRPPTDLQHLGHHMYTTAQEAEQAASISACE